MISSFLFYENTMCTLSDAYEGGGSGNTPNPNPGGGGVTPDPSV